MDLIDSLGGWARYQVGVGTRSAFDLFMLRYKASGVFWLFLYMICIDDCYVLEKSLGKYAISLSDMAI